MAMYCSCYEIYQTNSYTDHQHNVAVLMQFWMKFLDNESNTNTNTNEELVLVGVCTKLHE